MAQGLARVDQQAVENGGWAVSGRLPGGGDFPLSVRPVMPGCDQPGLRPDEILRTVEADIIPRVFMTRCQTVDPDPVTCRTALATAEIGRFSQSLLAYGDECAAMRFVEAVRARGLSVEDVYLQLFQPTARHIGDLWDADLCTFVDVTLALGLLQRLLRGLSPAFQRGERRFDAGRLALLVPLPGDQHTFGLSMVAEFFRRSAWSVWNAPFESCDDLGGAMRDTWFTVVGFSASREDRLDELAAAIRTVRRESCNPAVGVLVGGPIFVEHPDYVARVGADVVGLDARHALFQAECFASRTAV